MCESAWFVWWQWIFTLTFVRKRGVLAEARHTLKFKKAGRNLVLIPLSMKFSMNMAGILQYIISYVAQVPRRTYSLTYRGVHIGDQRKQQSHTTFPTLELRAPDAATTDYDDDHDHEPWRPLHRRSRRQWPTPAQPHIIMSYWHVMLAFILLPVFNDISSTLRY